MARKFFYIAAGMFLLALSYHLGAGTAGARGDGVASPTEVAALTGVLSTGETIPLPTYADGTTALESECRWIVSRVYDGGGDVWCYTANAVYPPRTGPNPGYGSDPAYYASHPGRVVNVGCSGSGNPLNASYLIIATRGASQPTPALHESWGTLKSRYRTTPAPTPG